MFDYRAYKLNLGRISERVDFEAVDDAAAMKYARCCAEGRDTEVWHFGRFVGEIKGSGLRAPSASAA